MFFYVVVSFVTLLVLQFVALCMVTRVERGRLLTGGGFALYVAVFCAFLWGCRAVDLSPQARVQLGSLVMWMPLTALMVLLSRGNLGRRFFVALDYVAYLTAILPVCHALAFGKLNALLCGMGAACSLAFLVAAHAVFLFILLPLVPHSDSPLPWHIGCLVAVVLFVLLYTTGIWPHSLVADEWKEWTAFLVASVVAWIVFPMMYAGLRSYLRNLGIERNLALMASEVATRRVAIDAARRQRHDGRHHRIALAEYLLRGQVDKALGYLEQLDREADRTPTDKLVWCENDTLNAILSGCARKAKVKGVEFEVTANVERTVNLPDIDVVAVVANLVENAIEAAGEWKSPVQRSLTCDIDQCPRVTVALRQREWTVGMTVTNPVPEGFSLSSNGLPCDMPGVGIESVRRMIDRYEGELVYTLEDGVLTCQAMLRVVKIGDLRRVRS